MNQHASAWWPIFRGAFCSNLLSAFLFGSEGGMDCAMHNHQPNRFWGNNGEVSMRSN